MKYLITGGTGFVGYHLVSFLLSETEADILILSRLSTSGNLNRLSLIKHNTDRLNIIHHDLRSPINNYVSHSLRDIDICFHLAASSHVDRSILDPLSFIYDNVVGTCNLLNHFRNTPTRVLYFSTDEVFGPAFGGHKFKEWSAYHSGNPYAATKAGAEELCLAYANTYSMNIVITHSMNIFGEAQHPEKFIPMTIRKILNEEVSIIHSNASKSKSGSRYYIYAPDCARATLAVSNCGVSGDKYNIVGPKEISNLDMALTIAGIMGKELKYELYDFHSSRPGHDLRYALDGSKMKSIGWHPKWDINDALERTVNWYLSNPAWL